MFEIMHKNTVIAKANADRITDVICEELCPACIFEGADLEFWLKSRSIDVHRSHSRQLYKALRLKTDSPIADIIEIGHGISITDNWWIRKEGDDLDYSSLKEYNQSIAEIALYGSSNKEPVINGYTELGTIGSYEKAWRFAEDSWYMYKQGSKAELISEYYAYQFLKAMNVPVADYIIHREQSDLGIIQECIITRDYTDNAKYDFEPFLNYFGENEDYDYIIPRLERMGDKGEKLAEDYVTMCFYDALLFNVDRHNVNVGFLRDSNTGEIISLAPCYDYNLSLAATKVPYFGSSGDLMKFFTESKDCMRIIKPLFPDKEQIKSAAKAAAKKTRTAFPDDNFKYSIFEEYIMSAYEYCNERFSEKTLDLTPSINKNTKNY